MSLKHRTIRMSISALAAAALAGPAAFGATNDRLFEMGDSPAESASAGAEMGTEFDGRTITFDSTGPSNAQAGNDFRSGFVDLEVFGDPVYGSDGVNSNFSAQLDGDGDALATRDIEALNLPASLTRNFAVASGSLQYPIDYTNLSDPSDVESDPAPGVNEIRSHGMQGWFKPSSNLQGTNQRVDVLNDTGEHQVYLDPPGDDPDNPDTTDNNQWQWGYGFDGGPILRAARGHADNPTNNGEPLQNVQFGENTHVMHVAGIDDMEDGSSASGSALYINGKAVDASGRTYDEIAPEGADISFTVGAIPDGDGGLTNHFEGSADNVAGFVWGDNEKGDNAVEGNPLEEAGFPDNLKDGEDWGRLDLNTDNQWIRQQWIDMNNGVDEGEVADSNIVAADIDMDGDLDQDDVDTFVDNWRMEKIFELTNPDDNRTEITVGDWQTRQLGDLNFDGVVGLEDFAILREAFLAETGQAPSLAAIPEPASLALLGLGGTLVLTRRRRS